MAAHGTLLCIHRDPWELRSLERCGYELVTATNRDDALRLFMSRPVDAIVLDYHFGLVDDEAIAMEIKKIKPEIPIVMLAKNLELPVTALKGVDALVAKSDGPNLLLATIRAAQGNPLPARKEAAEVGGPESKHRPRGSWDGTERRQSILSESTTNDKAEPFSPAVWKSIRNGSVRF